MSLTEWSGLLAVWLLSLLGILTLCWREFRRVRFNFNILFTLLFILTLWFGFPFTSLLVFRFDATTVPPVYLLEALLSGACFYAVYYLSYKTRWCSAQRAVGRSFLSVNRVEAYLIWGMLALVALGTALVFLLENGFLLYRLQAYHQIFSSQVAGVALKRFFYFFIPAMLIRYFLRQTLCHWFLFLILTLAFGLLTYAMVGGTRANLLIAFAIFLFIGLVRGWISLWMLLVAGVVAITAMFALALRRYHLDVSGQEAWHTFLYLTRDTFSPWENLALLLQNYDKIDFQGLAPIVRDFYVFIPGWLWPGRPQEILNSANYFTWMVLDNHSGLAISPTLPGSLLVMGGVLFLLPGAVLVGGIIKWFDWLYQCGRNETNRYKAAVIQSFCFGAVFNLIVLVREGLDAFVSRVVFFGLVFGVCILMAKLLFWLLDHAGLIRPRQLVKNRISNT